MENSNEIDDIVDGFWLNSNSRQIEENEDKNNNLNRNAHYNALICPVTRNNFSGIIMNNINEL